MRLRSFFCVRLIFLRLSVCARDAIFLYYYHRSIKMKPSQVTKSNEANVWETLYGTDVDKRVRFKFQVGDRVRISKVKRMFEKSYLPNFTEEMFTIYKRFRAKYLFTN